MTRLQFGSAYVSYFQKMSIFKKVVPRKKKKKKEVKFKLYFEPLCQMGRHTILN